MLRIGASRPREFFDAVVWVLWTSRAALYGSAALLAAGPVLGYLARLDLHMRLMVAGLYLFYFSVMYLQLPGFVNAAPRPWLSAATLAAFLAGTLGGGVYFIPFAALYAAFHLKALRGSGNYYPNWIMMAGLAATVVAERPIEAVAAFPLASALTLIYRIDTSRARLKFTPARAAAVAASYAVGYALLKIGAVWGLVLPIAATTAAAPPKVRDPYGVGSATGRLLMALAFLHHHYFYMGFAVLMSTLCVPFFLPSLLYRKMPDFGYKLYGIALVAFASRAVGQLAVAATAVVAAVGYTAVMLLRQEKIPLKPP